MQGQEQDGRHRRSFTDYLGPLKASFLVLSASLPLACQAADQPQPNAVQTPPEEVALSEDVSLAEDVPPIETMSEPGVCSGDMSPTLDGFQQGDPNEFIEAPDRDLIRATTPVEIDLTAKLVREDIRPPLRKSYCKMGIQTMVVDYDYPVEDDAVSSVTQRTVYGWRADERGIGWQIDAVGTRLNCFRGRAPETGHCL